MYLSKNFTLKELLRSNTALRMRYNEQFSPSADVVENLQSLVDNILQPLRETIGRPIRVNSGYRCYRVNKRIGGSKTSDHMDGCAADIKLIIDGENRTRLLFDLILEMQIPFKQLIYEYGTYDKKTGDGEPQWVHIAFKKGANHCQVLRAVRGRTKTIYKRWK